MPGRAKAAGGILIVIGLFATFCGVIMLLTAGWRGWREHRIDTQWFRTTAYVKKCDMRLYHPFSRDGGGTTYSLRCRLSYEFQSQHYDYTLYTTSSRSGVDQARIDEWLPEHGQGTTLAILVNPADPKEIAVLETLPIEQFNTSREAFITALAFGIAAALFLAMGRAIALSPVRA